MKVDVAKLMEVNRNVGGIEWWCTALMMIICGLENEGFLRIAPIPEGKHCHYTTLQHLSSPPLFQFFFTPPPQQQQTIFDLQGSLAAAEALVEAQQNVGASV